MEKYICVLDFEATCWEEKTKNPYEIIEFPSVLLRFGETGMLERVAEFQAYVKPVINPTLSAFCTQLTGITQSQVDVGVDLATALKNHQKWLAEHVGSGEVMIYTCGLWDLKTCAPADFAAKGIVAPAIYKRFVNVKFAFEAFYGKKSFGMENMLTYLKIPLAGRHHSGLDDCRNIASIVEKMVTDGIDVGNQSHVRIIKL
jgi:ERI1 exoribonuclease 3